MAAITGNDGNVTLPTGHTGSILRVWRASVPSAVTETTGFDDTINRRHRGGLIDVQGSASGSAEDTATSDPGAVHAARIAGAPMTLTAKTGKTWAFTGLMSNITLESRKIDNEGSITFDFTTGDADDFAETW